MGAFEYTAVDPSGKEKKGVLEGETPRQVRQLLRDRQLLPIAVTAVAEDRRVFRLANRGAHLDLSAPGVNIRHARPGGGYGSSSGTSFAAPFATVAIAAIQSSSPSSKASMR